MLYLNLTEDIFSDKRWLCRSIEVKVSVDTWRRHASPSEVLQHIPVMKKDAALIDRIEGLNTKARISKGKIEAQPTREEREKQLGIKADLSPSASIRKIVFKEKSHGSGTFNPPHRGSVDASITNGGHELTAIGRVMSKTEEAHASTDGIVGERMRGQALQGRVDD